MSSLLHRPLPALLYLSLPSHLRDLQLDGLRLKEEDADWELAQYEGLGGSYIADDEAAAAATRELLEQQQVAAEAAAARGSSSGGSSRDKYSKEAVWLQLSRSANRPGSTGSPYKGLASSAAYGTPVCDDEVQQVCGGRSYAGRYEWRPLLAAAKGRGWRPVDKRDGGGGTHIKLRRQVTLPGGSVHIQTMVLACTPGARVHCCALMFRVICTCLLQRPAPVLPP